MERNIKIVNGSGNVTAFVFDKTDACDYSAVAGKIMRADKRIEQVAFVISTESVIPRIEMMGGEFCGNASRCFAYLVGLEKGIDKGTVRISCSGEDRPVFAKIDTTQNTAFLQMTSRAEKIKTDGYLGIAFNGITHYVTDEKLGIRAAKKLLKELAEKTKSDAVGLLVRNRKVIKPIVLVKDTGSVVAEGSCGSGALALAFLECEGTRKEFEKTYKFPAGSLGVKMVRILSNAFEAEMGGTVEIME